jgi:DNA-nicking Smr family endonuclease
VNKSFPSHTKPQHRKLSAAELELWLDAAQTVLRNAGTRLPPCLPANSELHLREASRQPPKGAGLEEASKEAMRKVRPPVAPIDRRLRQKLSRGRAAPDAEIDLHGMRRPQAFVALRTFLLRAQSDGARLVLVVTGKGNRAASGDFAPGILRKCVPDWLCSSEYHAIVAGFEEAARPHGGSGALYVRLRRRSRPATEKSTS